MSESMQGDLEAASAPVSRAPIQLVHWMMTPRRGVRLLECRTVGRARNAGTRPVGVRWHGVATHGAYAQGES